MTILDTFFDDVIENAISVKPPVAVLKELALGLEKRTAGLLIGEVEQIVVNKSSFALYFYITSPSLNNYRYQALEIKHDLSFYPLEVYSSGGGLLSSSVPQKATNQEELEGILKSVFLSPQIKNVINGLLAQIKSTN